MAVDTKQVTGRRQIRYTHLEDLILDAERLIASGHHTIGNWSLGEILDHLAKTMHAAFDGFGMKAPLWARWFIAPFVKNNLLTKGIPSGYKLPAKASHLAPQKVTAEEGLESVRKAVVRFETGTPEQKHPFFGDLAPQEWVSLMLRHAEMHMSFVLPGAK